MTYGTGLELILNAAEGALQVLITEHEQLLCAQQWQKMDQGAEILAPTLHFLCRALDIRPTDFRRIACVRGPGSFTGIRLVLTTAAALRRAGKAKVAGLDYMQALATSTVLRRSLPYAARIWVLTHARRNLVHCQPFMAFGPRIPAQPLSPVELCTPEEALHRVRTTDAPNLASQTTGVWVCGSGLKRNAAVFRNLDGMGELPLPEQAKVAALPDVTLPDNKALCLLARHGDYLDQDLEPLYVRPCDAVENLAQIAPTVGLSADEASAALQAQLERTPRSEI
ncbi:MAG: tRNA (adenosine(37)-N6)-threonylcarbamoyltransferase complex dimerization subunit type 1 TsaB [Desulfovibrio sp.]|nr:tRNA (adenosine(37)-N6)-threonylcarbamoyltransferase complex dimerization subunit type 1 TsaB [Desulfovibrio sp.]